MTNNISRRPPPPLPQNLSQLTWNAARGPIHRFLLWLFKSYSGVPGGWKNTTPPTVLIGGAASAGNGNTAGWVSADAVFAAEAATPQAILLGVTAAEGTLTSTVRSDFFQNTIGLFAQVRNIVSMRV